MYSTTKRIMTIQRLKGTGYHTTPAQLSERQWNEAQDILLSATCRLNRLAQTTEQLLNTLAVQAQIEDSRRLIYLGA